MRHFILFSIFLGCLVPASQPFAEQAAEDDAKRFVEDSGVRGGLIVQVGCRNASWIRGLYASERYLVQGLDSNKSTVAAVRAALLQQELLGPVTVHHWPGGHLPYADNLVSLLIIDEGNEVSDDEIQRVLSPNGVVCRQRDGDWNRNSKAWPAAIDQWTHFLHGPDNNAVAEDTQVSPPKHMQWTASPRWGRSHDQLGSVSAVVSAAGRLFYIVDEGSVASVREPARWMLVARDAFNGVLLWKKSIGDWASHLRPFRSGPAELPRRLVAVENRVYVTLGYGQPVSVLDAATGEEIRCYRESENAQEIVVTDGKVFIIAGGPPTEEDGAPVPELPEWLIPYPQRVLTFPSKQMLCLDAESGDLLWKRADQETTNVLALTMAISKGRVFFHNEKNLVALDATSGETRWTAERPVSLHRYAWSVPTLVVKDGIVLSGDRTSEEQMNLGQPNDRTRPRWLISSGHDLFPGEIIAFSAETGKRLWSVPCHESFNAPVDVFVARNQVWSGQVAWTPQPGIAQVYDLQTGEVVARRPPDSEFGRFGHHRCYRAKATVNYVLHSRRGIEFVDMDSDQLLVDRWLRGTCQYGILPCNGMIYTPPHSCACYVTHQLNSFNALTGKSSRVGGEIEQTDRFETGPAYTEVPASERTVDESSADWPTYRGDAARSGVASSEVSPDLLVCWQQPLGGRLTPPVVADARVFVARTDAHTLFALDAENGEPLWNYPAGAPIDSPPTVLEGLVYFGSADGWAYCLRVDDGRLVWRYRVAPQSNQIVSYERLESSWPLHGGLLVQCADDGTQVVYGVAGRSTYLDNGIILFGLHAKTGEVIHQQRLYCPSPESKSRSEQNTDGSLRVDVLPDILSTDGQHLFMRNQAFDLTGKPLKEKIPHLFCSAGFLDDTWWHRTYWQYGVDMSSGFGSWILAGNRRVSGRLLVSTKDRLFGFGRKDYQKSGSHLGLGADYHLFAAEKPASIEPLNARRTDTDGQVHYDWSVELPVLVRAMVLSADHLIVAGPQQIADVDRREPDGPVTLRVVAASDGQTSSEYPLSAAPVFDGMAVADGRVVLTTVDGKTTCFSSR